MAIEIVVPQIGQDIETGILQDLYIKPGDYVKKGDPVASVESDKATFDIEAYDSGYVLRILNEIGDEVKVLAPIIYLGDKNEKVQQDETGSEQGTGSTVAQSSSSPLREIGKRIKASPLARRMAGENAVDLETVSGSGPGGRIVKRDILKAMMTQRQPEMLLSSSEHTSAMQAGDQIVEFSPMRRRIAERLEKSKKEIPHFYLYITADVTRVLALREAHNRTSARKISVNDIIVRASAEALRSYPDLNAHFSDRTFIRKKNINIGIAVSVDDGLLVPVISNADTRTLIEIAEISEKLIADARKRIISPNQTGTFTVSNLGMHGIELVFPIINPPECAILGVGGIEKRLVPLDDSTFGSRDFMKLSLACDHRVIDGVYGSAFLNEVRKNLENFTL